MNILLSALLLAGSITIAQGKDIPASQVPSVIVNQFNADFPKASDIDWEVKDNVYKVDFQIGWFKDIEAWYSAQGTQVKVNEELSKKELPKAIITALEKNYKLYKIEEIDKITQDNKTTYKIEVEKQEDERTLYFNENGTLLK